MRNIIHKGLFFLAYHHAFDWLDDVRYLKLLYWARTAKHLHLSEPETFNEKLQWLKLHDRRPEYTKMVDKYAVKDYVAGLMGEEYIIPTLGVWDSFDEIDFDSLPNRFVLKCTHDSGGLVICRDKDKLDIKSAKKKINRSLRSNYFMASREWPYKNVPKKIIAEKYMEDESGALNDYKFFCFDGYVDCVMVCLDRNSGDTKFYFFDEDWNLLRLNKRGKEAPAGFTVPKPSAIKEMFKMASELSKGLIFARIDMYNCKGKIYFGEITFFPESGFDRNLLPEAGKRFGDLIDITRVKKPNDE